MITWIYIILQIQRIIEPISVRTYRPHNLAKFSEKPDKAHFEGLVNQLIYIRENKTLGLKYYADMNDAPVSDLLRKASIKNDNHLINFLILVGKVVQTLDEVQEHTLSFIKVGQFTMAHMLQDHFLNQV